MEMDNKTKIETKGEGLRAHQKLKGGWASEVDVPQRKTIFLGEYKHSIDDKSRLALPIKYRETFAKGIVITRGLDNCLFAYPRKDWERLTDKISKLPLTQSNARAFSRLMLAGAIDGKLDKQGRIILPLYLKQYAALKNKVTIAGVYNRLEIWSRGRWGRYKKNAEENSSEIAENLSELGI
jgi:MraZ protein